MFIVWFIENSTVVYLFFLPVVGNIDSLVVGITTHIQLLLLKWT